MISSEEGYELALDQLQRLERALASLRRDVLPKSEQRYRLMAEPYEEKIEEIQRELREYRSRLSRLPAPRYLSKYPSRSAFLGKARRAFAA